MALVTPSFDDVKDDISAGTYHTRVTKVELGEWKTGTKHLASTLETMNEKEPKNNGRKITYRVPIEGKGAFLLQRFYKALTGETLAGGFDTEQLLGKEVIVTVADGKDKEGNPTGYTEVAAVKSVQ